MLSVRKIFLITILLIPFNCFSQGISNNWLLGYGENFPYGPFGGTTIDFYSGYADTMRTHRLMNIFDVNASISDSAGNLLFYTNGLYIANANNDTMLNGSGLNPSAYANSSSPYGLRIPQGALILQKPGSPNLYYIFHETLYYLPQLYVYYEPLEIYYTIVDMNLDGGLGGVIFKNVTMLADTLNSGGITACKHANGRDWWIIFHRYNATMYYKYLFKAAGSVIQGPFTQNIGSSINSNWIWQSCFSPDGKKFATITGRDTLDVFSFDRCTGMLYLLESISIPDNPFARGLAFSPNSKYLYVSSTSFVYQFNTDTVNINASKIIVGLYDGYADPSIPFNSGFYLAQLANDGKIYLCTTGSCNWMHVINHPNDAGLSCGFAQHNFLLPTTNASSVPNFPNYFLGAESGSICDSLITNIKPHVEYNMRVYPNPADNVVYLKMNSSCELTNISLFNIIGQEFNPGCTRIDDSLIRINTTSMSNGIYLLRVKTSDGIRSFKIQINRN